VQRPEVDAKGFRLLSASCCLPAAFNFFSSGLSLIFRLVPAVLELDQVK
jgi:hypothetical protein